MAILMHQKPPTAAIVDTLPQRLATGMPANAAAPLCPKSPWPSDIEWEEKGFFVSVIARLADQSKETYRQSSSKGLTSEPASQGFFRASAVSAIEELTCLDRGWDGRRAVPVDRAVAKLAISFVRELQPYQLRTMRSVPFADGRMQLEWDLGERSLEIEFTQASEAHYLKWDPPKSVEEEGTVSPFDFIALKKLVDWFFYG